MNTDRYIPPFPAGETAFLSVKEETALIDRIRLPIDIDTFNPNACWLAVPSRHLYTSFGWHGEITRTHRVSYRHFHCAAIPKGFVVNQLCENAGCINPDHLETVSPSDNARYSISPFLVVIADREAKVRCVYADYRPALAPIADLIVATVRARKAAAIERARSLPELPDNYIPPDQLIPYSPA